MPVAIVSFAVEIIILFVQIIISPSSSPKGYGNFAIAEMIIFSICTVVSIFCIIYNASHIKNYITSKGVAVTGLVFSIVGSVIGLIFCISFLAGIFVAAAR